MTTNLTPVDIAGYAAHLVYEERQGEFGHPLDNYNRAAQIWSVILVAEVTAEQVALCMI